MTSAAESESAGPLSTGSARTARAVLPVVVVLSVLAALGSLGIVLLMRVAGLLDGRPPRIGFWPETAQEPVWPWPVLWAVPVLVGLSALTLAWSRRGVGGAWRVAPAPVMVTVVGMVGFGVGVITRSEFLAWSGVSLTLTGAVALVVNAVRWQAVLLAVSAVEVGLVGRAVGAGWAEVGGLVALVAAGGCLTVVGVVRLQGRLRGRVLLVGLLVSAVATTASAAVLLVDQGASSRNPQTLVLRSYELASVSSSSEGRYLATVTGFGDLEIEDRVTGAVVRRRLDQGSAWVRFSADGRELFVDTYLGNGYVWDVSSSTWHNDGGRAGDSSLSTAAVTASGAVVSAYFGSDVVVGPVAGESTAPKRLSSLRGAVAAGQGGPSITALGVGADGRVVAAGYDDGELVVTDVGGDSRVLALASLSGAFDHHVWVPYRYVPAGAVSAVAVSPDGRTVAVATVDGRLRLVDTVAGTTRAELRRSLLSADVGRAQCLEFTADGRRLLAGYVSGAVQLWTLPAER